MVPLLGLNELSAESRGQSLTLEKTLTLWKLRERFSQRTVVPGALRGASMCCGVAVLRCCGGVLLPGYFYFRNVLQVLLRVALPSVWMQRIFCSITLRYLATLPISARDCSLPAMFFHKWPVFFLARLPKRCCIPATFFRRRGMPVETGMQQVFIL